MRFFDRLWELIAGYRFPDGSRLLSDGRDGEIYVSPSGRKVSVQCELLDTASGIERCIYASSINAWMPPHEKEAFTEHDRTEVLVKISQFYRQNDTRFVIK